MRFEPRRAPLRGGRHCIIREVAREDAAAQLELERAIVRARQGIVKHEDELPADAAAYAEQRDRAGLTATDGSALCLAAELEGVGLAGEVTLLRLRPRMVRHVGILGLGVHPEAQGLGVGRALLERLLEWARAHRDADGGRVLRVELYVRADNARAIALYRSVGFAHEGTRRGFVRADDGAFVDDLIMGLSLAPVDDARVSRR
ncbi:N-acetyltransferase family protein [Sorangium sp. So ce406]|uniref:GNAT family N-acetyltransferase n=1 Tax=Sorangium sp. So ce406 TaxID=3133311 RepID=UPI003F5C1A29